MLSCVWQAYSIRKQRGTHYQIPRCGNYITWKDLCKRKTREREHTVARVRRIDRFSGFGRARFQIAAWTFTAMKTGLCTHDYEDELIVKKCPGQRIEVFTDVVRHAATIHLISRQGRALADNSQLNGEVNQSQSPCQWSSNTYRVCRLLNRFTLVTLRLECGGCEIRHRIGSRFHHHASINDAQILIFKSNIKIFGQLAVFFQ